MPLLQSIVQEFDRELTRLEALRKIVAGLSRTPAVVRRLTEFTPAAAASSPLTETRAPQPARRRRTSAGQPRQRQAKAPATEPRALASSVPSGPVVFYPGRHAEPGPSKRTRQEPVPGALPDPSPEALDAQSRALAARWATGPI